MKKLLILLTAIVMVLSLAACGKETPSNNEDTSSVSQQQETQEAPKPVEEDPTQQETEEAPVSEENSTEASGRDKTFELSNEEIVCVIEYDSSICSQFEYDEEDEKDVAYIRSDVGGGLFGLTKGSTSAEDYVEKFKQMKEAGNNSYYRVEDLVVKERHSCEVKGYTYKTFTYSYVDVYVEQNAEYETFGMLGYVQLTDDIAIVVENDLYYDNWTEFVESMLYIKEVTVK